MNAQQLGHNVVTVLFKYPYTAATYLVVGFLLGAWFLLSLIHI